jgi:hypothetical protein
VSTTIKSALEAAVAGRTSEALALVNALVLERADCPYLLVWQAILIQVQDPVGPQTLEDAEAGLLQAYATDPNYLPAIQELAHYYDAVRPDADKALAFATQYIEKSQKILDEMRQIIDGAA